jgi:hypothetical protein
LGEKAQVKKKFRVKLALHALTHFRAQSPPGSSRLIPVDPCTSTTEGKAHHSLLGASVPYGCFTMLLYSAAYLFCMASQSVRPLGWQGRAAQRRAAQSRPLRLSNSQPGRSEQPPTWRRWTHAETSTPGTSSPKSVGGQMEAFQLHACI